MFRATTVAAGGFVRSDHVTEMLRALFLLAAAGFVLPTSPCLAQDGALLQVQPGAILRLHFADTLWVVGRVVGELRESVPLRRPGPSRPTIEYRVASLDSIQAEAGSHALTGTGIGLTVGYILGRVLVAHACSGRGQASGTCRVHPEAGAIGNAVTLLVGGIGFLAGRGARKWTRIR